MFSVFTAAAAVGGLGGLGGLYYWWSNRSRAKKNSDTVPENAMVNLDAVLSHPVPRKDSVLRRGLTIGINYTGTANALYGCINDSDNIKRLWMDQCKVNELCYLTDTTPVKPTRANIVYAIRWLVRGVKDGDYLYFHYSGHGSQQKATGTDFEEDGKDECLVPLDYDTAGLLVDDIVYQELIEPLNGKRLTLVAVVDACHSGTMLDLPFMGAMKGAGNDLKLVTKFNLKFRFTDDQAKPTIFFLSGCADAETSADAAGDANGPANGALTSAYINSWRELKYNATLDQLFSLIHRKLASTGFTQHPELGSNKAFNPTFKWI